MTSQHGFNDVFNNNDNNNNNNNNIIIIITVYLTDSLSGSSLLKFT